MSFLMLMPHTSAMSSIRRFTRAFARQLRHAWRVGFDEHDARHQMEQRARRLFNAIMTERYAECLVPIALRRQAP